MENRLSMELLEHGVLNTTGNCQSKELVSTSAILMQIVDVYFKKSIFSNAVVGDVIYKSSNEYKWHKSTNTYGIEIKSKIIFKSISKYKMLLFRHSLT